MRYQLDFQNGYIILEIGAYNTPAGPVRGGIIKSGGQLMAETYEDEDLEDVKHSIKVKLYHSNLPDTKGYVARTDSEAVMNIEQICAKVKTRTKFEGDYAEMVDHVKRYFKEAVYQLCNGFSVTNGYFTIYPNVGGLFKTPGEHFDPKKHTVTMRYRARDKLRRAAKKIIVVSLGLASTEGYIDEFTDASTGTVNDIIHGGESFIITGDKIKVVDDGVNTDCGVYLELLDGPDAGKRIKVTKRLIENTPSKIIGNAPVLIAPIRYRVVIVTQYNGTSNTFLKTPKTLASGFELTCA